MSENYRLYPLRLPWADDPNPPGDPRERHRKLVELYPTRVEYFSKFIGLYPPNTVIDTEVFGRDHFVCLGDWLERRIRILPNGYLDIDTRADASNPTKYGNPCMPTKIAESICIDCAMIFARAMMDLNQGFRWYFKPVRKGSRAFGMGSTVLESRVVHYESWPWQNWFHLLVGVGRGEKGGAVDIYESILCSIERLKSG